MSQPLNWPLIFVLAGAALIRPSASMLGLLEAIGQPAASIIITIFITIVWIGVTAAKQEAPLSTLLCTGLMYGIYAIVLSGVLSPILLGEIQGPLTNPFAVVSVLVTNGIWGLAAGGITALINKGKGESHP
ncbi:hypothetical protein [Salibacterium aidingense]|uniref:hypothetical protein n=1 Tax=Salibacterium aidingense TaxID=384933 RepID=UPI0003F81646|nr:hypothetical protein [Salibacterium aidingense]